MVKRRTIILVNFIMLNWMLGGIAVIGRSIESSIPITDSSRSCNLIKFNGKIELGATLSMGCCRRDITVPDGNDPPYCSNFVLTLAVRSWR